ncbi:hypothetical protein KQX54_001700 [Cotesia glomerata]|uniref:Uncharacterized protein n=1 Tax=Cotesia glomerata TaxID=32391 RepID=A0AAV7IVW6_COTGL|nr:hypothetical protein KQX54_001700 [Cotesia glomerata]
MADRQTQRRVAETDVESTIRVYFCSTLVEIRCGNEKRGQLSAHHVVTRNRSRYMLASAWRVRLPTKIYRFDLFLVRLTTRCSFPPSIAPDLLQLALSSSSVWLPFTAVAYLFTYQEKHTGWFRKGGRFPSPSQPDRAAPPRASRNLLATGAPPWES